MIFLLFIFFFFFLVDLFWMNPIDFVFIIYVIYYIKTMTKFAQNRKRRRKHFICRESGLFFSKNRFSRFFPKKTQKNQFQLHIFQSIFFSKKQFKLKLRNSLWFWCLKLNKSTKLTLSSKNIKFLFIHHTKLLTTRFFSL